MQAQDDLTLLREYATTGSAEAFARVVARHADFVFATALRQTRSHDLAEDVTQATFIVLARRARGWGERSSVAGFLHQTAIFAAKNAVRSQMRRRRHEHQAAIEATNVSPPVSPPVVVNDDAVAVDRALNQLRSGDRQFLTLHYFDGLNIDDVAGRLRISREAARKRLHRALSRLRDKLGARGATASAATLPAMLEAISHPSVNMESARIASTAAAGGNGGSAFELARLVTHAFRWMAIQKAAIAAVCLGAVAVTGTVAVEHVLATSQSARQVQVAVPVANAIPSTRPTIVDYAVVFEQMQLTRDLRAKLEQERQTAEQEISERAIAMGNLRKQRDALPKDSQEYARLDKEYKDAVADDAAKQQATKLQMRREQVRLMAELYQKIEAAVTAVAATHGLMLTAPAQAAYPAHYDAMDVDHLRALLNKRLIVRVANAPDLTREVITYLDAHPDLKVPGLPAPPPGTSVRVIPPDKIILQTAPVQPSRAPTTH